MRWSELYEDVRRSNGALHITDGEPHGISVKVLQGRARREGWPRPHPGYGVLLVPGVIPSRLTAISAAVKAVGSPVFAGRRTAAWVHGALDRAVGPIELVVPNERRSPKLRGVRVWRTRTMTEHQVTEAQGVPVTTMARTVIDLAAVLPFRMLRDLTTDALQRGLLSITDLHDLVEQMIRPPGIRKVRNVLGVLAQERPESALDLRTRKLLRSHRFAPHPRPFPFRCPDGIVIHLDIAIPWAWFALECDGFAFHSGREAFRTDRIRWSQAQRGGWRLTWVDHHRLENDPASIVEEVQEALAEADPERPPPRMADCRCAPCSS